MPASDWKAEQVRLAKLLRDRLGSKDTCLDVLDDFEELVRSIWGFTAQLLGDSGTKAIWVRAIHLARYDVPLLLAVQIHDRGVNFDGFRAHIVKVGCNTPDVLDALLRLGMMVFQTLSSLAGDAITGPLLDHLEKQ